jgi:hypothetical protein
MPGYNSGDPKHEIRFVMLREMSYLHVVCLRLLRGEMPVGLRPEDGAEDLYAGVVALPDAEDLLQHRLLVHLLVLELQVDLPHRPGLSNLAVLWEPEPQIFSLAEPCFQILFMIMNRN